MTPPQPPERLADGGGEMTGERLGDVLESAIYGFGIAQQEVGRAYREHEDDDAVGEEADEITEWQRFASAQRDRALAELRQAIGSHLAHRTREAVGVQEDYEHRMGTGPCTRCGGSGDERDAGHCRGLTCSALERRAVLAEESYKTLEVEYRALCEMHADLRNAYGAACERLTLLGESDVPLIGPPPITFVMVEQAAGVIKSFAGTNEPYMAIARRALVAALTPRPALT